MEEFVLNVEGMECSGCENRIQNVVRALGIVDRVIAHHESGKVEVTVAEDRLGDVKRAIENIGFKVVE